jgi:hypothetical protein
MRKRILVFASTLLFVSALFALPLTATIFQESAKLARRVADWNKQCGAKTEYDEACDKKRHALCRDLGEFVALVNDELNFLRGPISPDAPTGLIEEGKDRRKIMELEVRVALHNIKCLGAVGAEAECSAEAKAIEADKAALQRECEQARKEFDPRAWISIPVAAPPKKP